MQKEQKNYEGLELELLSVGENINCDIFNKSNELPPVDAEEEQ